MMVVRILWAFLTSRLLWAFLALSLLGCVIWLFGPLIGFGESRPFVDPVVRVMVIGALFFFWLGGLLWLVAAKRRAIRANRLFVSDLSDSAQPLDPATEAVRGTVDAQFDRVLFGLKRWKPGRELLREMPWYVVLGPRQSGKKTIMRQSAVSVGANSDLQEIGGSQYCRWFFSASAVFICPSEEYTSQHDWLDLLQVLKSHRGTAALNGIIVTIPIDTRSEYNELSRDIRRTMIEIYSTLELRIPIYLLVTKMDKIEGFCATFEGMANEERYQLWGNTFSANPIRPIEVDEEFRSTIEQLKLESLGRIIGADTLPKRAGIFRFPILLADHLAHLSTLVKYTCLSERSEVWLRGIFFTAMSPTASGAGKNDLPFCAREVFRRVIFRESGLSTFNRGATVRRTWYWRGAAVVTTAVLVLGTLTITNAYLLNRGAVVAQASEFDRLRSSLASVAARQAPVEPLDLQVALQAATEVQNARAPLPNLFARVVGPSAAPQIEAAQGTAYDRTLRNILEPRMVALLEATMWRNIRDPDFLFGGLKVYRMMTGLSPFDPGFVATWWTERLPPYAETPPFPNQAALEHQLAAIARMATDVTLIAPDESLVARALVVVCAMPLSRRAYDALRSAPAATALPEWLPANFAGPNGSKVFMRRSGDGLRSGIDGLYTYAGFHEVVLERLEEVAAQAALDRSVFAGGCEESAGISVDALAEDMLKLYYDDFIAQWDALLRDLTLAPITDLAVASANLKDLANPDSALRRLLTAIAAETDLVRPADAPAGDGGPPTGTSKVLGELGKLAKKGLKFAPAGGSAPDTSGQPVSDHFKALRGTVQEVDGAPPALDDAAAALAALSNMLQTVQASPNPEQAIKDAGGLVELTGAVVNQAALMPDPLDDWLAGIGGIRDITEKAVVEQLNAVWRADVLPFCKAALAGRYPFDPGSAVDVNAADFARVFGPGGLIDGFVNDQLLPYVDDTARPWQWRADLGLDAGALAAIEQARRIRDGLFPGGAGPIMTFTLEPKDLSPTAARVALDLDGQVLNYFNSATRPAPMTWPGKDGTGVVTLAFQPVDGSPEVIRSETGSWAWLRMMGDARLEATERPDVFRLRLEAGGYYADFELRANSADNPFDPRIFWGFECPDSFVPNGALESTKPARRTP